MHLHEKKTLFDLDLWVKVKQDVSKYPLHHVTLSDTKNEVATSDCLGGETFTKNTLFDLTLTFGSRSHKMVTSNLSSR